MRLSIYSVIGFNAIIIRQVVVAFDEMKIHEGLVFDAMSGNIIGYVDTGDMNEKLKKFEISLTGKVQKKKVTTHILASLLSNSRTRVI